MRELSRRDAVRALALGAVGAGLAVGVGACGAPAPPPATRLRLATGPAGAVYREMGAALVELWNDEWGDVVVEKVHTDASVDNLDLLLARDVELGLLNVDVARAHTDELRALLRVFDSVLHLVVPAGSDVRTARDLEGRRVSVGLPGSGTRFLVDRVLSTADITVEPVSLGQDEAARALLAGEIDVLASLTAMPTPALLWLLDQPGEGIRFVGLGPVAGQMHRSFPGDYLDVTISGSVYPGVGAVDAIAMPTLLTVRPDFDDELARFLVRVTLEEAPVLARNRPVAQQINPRTAVATAPVALHPGAAEWFRDAKP